MFSSKRYIDQKTGKDGVGRYEYLQQLVTEFQDTDSQEAKQQVLANLANFAYDPVNYDFIRQLNIIDLFLDNLSVADGKLVEFSIGGICNLCLDRGNKDYIIQHYGIPLVIQCLSSSNENTVLSAITTLMYLVTPQSKKDITPPPIVECMLRFSNSVDTRLANLANVFLQDYCTQEQIQYATQMQPQGLLGIPLPDSHS